VFHIEVYCLLKAANGVGIRIRDDITEHAVFYALWSDDYGRKLRNLIF
jgi:hypothetical protein